MPHLFWSLEDILPISTLFHKLKSKSPEAQIGVRTVESSLAVLVTIIPRTYTIIWQKKVILQLIPKIVSPTFVKSELFNVCMRKVENYMVSIL